MNARLAALLSELSQLGISLEPDGDQLRVRAPEGVLNGELRKALSEHKVELLTLLRRAAFTASTIPLVPRDQRLPLSFAQQRLWVLNRLDPTSSAYNMPVRWQLIGVLDTTALRRSLNALIVRHESLRTTIRDRSGRTGAGDSTSAVLSISTSSMWATRLLPNKPKKRIAWRWSKSIRHSIWRRVRCFARCWCARVRSFTFCRSWRTTSCSTGGRPVCSFAS